MIQTLATAAIGLLTLAHPVWARDDDAATRAMNARVNVATFRAIDAGFRLFNANDHAGCYRVYQGALTALLPLLDYRDDLKATVEAALAESETIPDYAGRAFALRKALDSTFKATAGPPSPPRVPKPDRPPTAPMPEKPPTAPMADKPATTPMPAKDAKPLWDRLGGEPAVRAVVHDFVAKAASDPKVDLGRGGKFKLDDAAVVNLEKLLVELVSATAGGPLKYTGRDMKESHKGMGITDAQFGALAADLVEVLKEYKVPQKEIDELIGIIATTKKDIVEAK